MIVLAASTSSARGSVAVRSSEIAACVEFDSHNDHAERLFGAIEAALTRSAAKLEQVSLVACDVGPGSFTGIRVALAAMLGIARARRIPIVGVGSLEAMASAAFERDQALAQVWAALDARKDEAFVALHDRALVEIHPACHLPREAARALIGPTSPVVGAFAEQLGLAPTRGPELDLPHALAIAALAARRHEQASGPSATPRARYVRPPDAKTLAEQGKAG